MKTYDSSILDALPAREERRREEERGAPSHVRILKTQDDSASSESVMPPRDFLLTIGADTLPHGNGRTLYQHLCGTEDLLVQAMRPVHEQLAGLFHSIYGTQIYTRSRGLVSREEVVKVIGLRAESLVFLFCKFRRRIPAILDCLFDDDTNESLLWLEYCNILEQDLHEFGRPDDPNLQCLARRMVTKPNLKSILRGGRRSMPY